MQPPDDLYARLEASSSVASLRAEQEIISVLREQQWRCCHGAFYLDSIEKKLREIDVLGMQTWMRQTRDREELSYLNLIVEAKSAKDWQIVFSSDQSTDGSCGYSTRVWSGFIDHDKYSWLPASLRSAGILDDKIPSLRTVFENRAFSNGMALMPPTVEPPIAAHIVTAFRETNIGKEKDLDNSVLWRAISGLRSTTKALESACEKYHVDWFGDPNLRGKSGPQLLEHFTSICDISLGRIDFYHPIVVIDANLWLVESQSLTPIPSCRFHQLDHSGSVTWWCDVVRSSEFSSHAVALSSYYANAFKEYKSVLFKS